MRFRFAAALPLTAACLLAAGARADSGSSPPPAEPPPAASTEFREAYENAWAHRQAGDYETAVGVADAALERIAQLLALDPPAAQRRDLVELQSRLKGLRSAARRDLASAAAARAAGNEADAGVLNAPALEEIEAETDNPQVRNWIRFFTNAGRSTFERWLKRSGRYAELFRSVLQREGMPPDLVHVVFVESGFNLNARSPSAAVGPWQFILSTGRLFGLTVNQWVDERKDPEKSTVAAARYLKHLYSIFGDWPLALASYNAGEGTVLRAIKRQGTTNYWDLRLPRQTEDYVPQFMAVLAIARDPREYGLDAVELDQPIDFDEIALKGTVDLRALARLADCTVEELRDLNPAVLRHAVRGSGDITTLRVPAGKGEVLVERLQEGAALPAVDLTLRHRVRRGETLQGIADHYHVSAQRLARVNDIGKKRPLRRGMALTVPVSAKPPTLAALAEDDPRASTAYVPERNIATPAAVEGSSDGTGRMTVRVAKGESLGQIARRHGVTAADIMRWNRLESARIRPGMRLKIRTADAAPDARAPDSATAEARATAAVIVEEAPPRFVVVRRGDTLSTLAHRHGTSVAEIRRANGLHSNRILAGQRLKLPG